MTILRQQRLRARVQVQVGKRARPYQDWPFGLRSGRRDWDTAAPGNPTKIARSDPRNKGRSPHQKTSHSDRDKESTTTHTATATFSALSVTASARVSTTRKHTTIDMYVISSGNAPQCPTVQFSQAVCFQLPFQKAIKAGMQKLTRECLFRAKILQEHQRTQQWLPVY